MKNNISFYRHEVTSHNHWKFKTLRRKYTWEGEGKFWALNNIIADAECCMLDLSNETKKMAIAADLDFDLSEFDAYIDYLTNVCRLLKVENGFYTTEIVQEIYNDVDQKRERQRNWKKEKSTAKSEKSTETFQKSTAKTQKSTVDSEQSKVKESKVNKSKEESNKENIVVSSDKSLPTSQQTLQEKIKLRKERMAVFRSEVKAYDGLYPAEMLKAFYEYWIEPNKSKTKMKFELERTWDLKLRLVRWEKNNFQFNKGKQQVDEQSDIQQQIIERKKFSERAREILNSD
jgi:hypothetical protein